MMDSSKEEKRQLLKQLLREQKVTPASGVSDKALGTSSKDQNLDRYASFADVEQFPEVTALHSQFEILTTLSMTNPYFRVNEGAVNNKTHIDGRELLSFSSYNYLGLSGDQRISDASKAAIDAYGTSVSASRVATGERKVHGELEAAISQFMGTDDALVFVSGHATNVSVIGHLLRASDLILYDEFSHNCIIDGMRLSGARRLPFRHNDAKDCERILEANRTAHERVLIAVEGIYSMDGDIVDLPAFVELKKKYHTLLMVDEAHSIGTLGLTGRGVGEHFSLEASAVDLWMGTLSKAFASCGGYIAGSEQLVHYLRYSTPGFLFSVGMTPSNAAAALASISLLSEDSTRVERLQSNAAYFLKQARAVGLDVGLSEGTPVVPVIIGSSAKALQVSDRLFQKGINVQPIIYPAVPENEARLRFFITCDHTEKEMDGAVEAVKMQISGAQGL